MPENGSSFDSVRFNWKHLVLFAAMLGAWYDLRYHVSDALVRITKVEAKLELQHVRTRKLIGGEIDEAAGQASEDAQNMSSQVRSLRAEVRRLRKQVAPDERTKVKRISENLWWGPEGRRQT